MPALVGDRHAGANAHHLLVAARPAMRLCDQRLRHEQQALLRNLAEIHIDERQLQAADQPVPLAGVSNADIRNATPRGQPLRLGRSLQDGPRGRILAARRRQRNPSRGAAGEERQEQGKAEQAKQGHGDFDPT
jgi:hypothetical protein